MKRGKKLPGYEKENAADCILSCAQPHHLNKNIVQTLQAWDFHLFLQKLKKQLIF